MNCIITASTNAHYLGMQADDDLQAAREEWAERNKVKHLNDVYFVTENMADFICQNVELGMLWQAGKTDEFIAEIKDHLNQKAYEAELDTAKKIPSHEFEPEVDYDDCY